MQCVITVTHTPKHARMHVGTLVRSQSVLLMSTFCSQLSSAHRQASYWIRGTGLNKTGRLSLSISSSLQLACLHRKIPEIEGLWMSTRRDNTCRFFFLFRQNKSFQKRCSSLFHDVRTGSGSQRLNLNHTSIVMSEAVNMMCALHGSVYYLGFNDAQFIRCQPSAAPKDPGEMNKSH